MARKCPTPLKARFPSREHAHQRAAWMYRERLTPLRLRAYRCPCKQWHLTKLGPLEAEIARLMRIAIGASEKKPAESAKSDSANTTAE